MSDPQPHSILIVEDERLVAKDIQQTLRELGYDAFAIASSAEDAIARAAERCPDLALMDIRIKGERDGIETAAILRAKFGIPIVYLSAYADDKTLERAKATEPHGYLLKPVRAAELRSVVEVALYKHAMEKRLREREHWFSTTLRSIADAVITVDLAGNVTFMNPAAEALTGATAADSVGKAARDVVRLVHTGDRLTGQDRPLATALREQSRVGIEEGQLLNITTGAVRTISDSAAQVIGDRGALGAVMVFRDVTERKQMQTQLEVTDRLASLGTMAAGVAHEINNPLAVVVANAGYVAEELTQHRAELEQAAVAAALIQRLDPIAEALGDLHSAATRIARIVSDLGAFSDPAPFRPGVIVDISRCIQWAIRTTAHELRGRARVLTRLGDVPAVRGDETRLGQVLINLLVNAAQAIAPGHADANEVCIATSTSDGGWVSIEVRDTGAGIPREHLGRIFEPFFTTKPIGVGTGLGLSVCHGIVTSLGGELRIESEPGKGTRCVVLLPPAPTEAPVRSISPPPTGRKRRRILVVDDEELVLRTVERVLQEHEIVCTGSVEEALALALRGGSFDLILADAQTSNRTGVGFYEALLAHGPELAGRVVFLCGGTMSPAMEDFLASVPNPRIETPFDAAALREAVQQLLEPEPQAGIVELSRS